MSYTIPALLDIDNYLKYSTDTNPTTNDDMQDYMGNQNATLKNLVGGGGLWQPNTEYAQNTVVWSPNMQPNTLAIVTSEGGTTGSTEPSWTAAGTAIKDGSITYDIRPHLLTSSDIMADILLAAHPVGSYYWSKSSTSPATLFGGTWEQVKDKFVYAAGTKGVGSTGGSENVTLTINQIPTHTHSASADTQGNHTHSASADTQGNHTHSVTSSASNGNGVSWAEPSSGPAGYAVSSGTSNTTSTNGAHSHNITVQTGGGHSHNINVGDNGGGQAHENMPPYIVAYCWCRTA